MGLNVNRNKYKTVVCVLGQRIPHAPRPALLKRTGRDETLTPLVKRAGICLGAQELSAEKTTRKTRH